MEGWHAGWNHRGNRRKVPSHKSPLALHKKKNARQMNTDDTNLQTFKIVLIELS